MTPRLALPWRSTATGIEIVVRVTPRGGRDAFDGVETLSNGKVVLRLKVRAAPDDGEANRAVEKLVASGLGVGRSRVRIAKGHTSRVKHITVDGEPSLLLKKLQEMTGARQP